MISGMKDKNKPYLGLLKSMIDAAPKSAFSVDEPTVPISGMPQYSIQLSLLQNYPAYSWFLGQDKVQRWLGE